MKEGHILKLSLVSLIILLEVSLVPTGLHAAHYIYKQLSIKEGLLTSIYSIYKEKNKYVWFGTRNGVYRYDGHESKLYQLTKSSQPYIQNITYQITPDSIGNLWVLTENGIFRYQQEQDIFKEVTDESGHSIPAFCYCMDPKGFFIGSLNRIYKYNYQSSQITLIKKLSQSKPIAINHLHLSNPDNLLFCGLSSNGVLSLHLPSGRIQTNIFKNSAPISCLYVDSHNRIWVAGYNYGLQCFNSQRKEIANYTLQNSNLSNAVILCMTEVGNNLWIGTDGGGINILEPQSSSFKILSHIPGDQHSLPANSIRCLYNDHYNNIWAGSIRDGIINIHEGSIQTYSDTHFNGKFGLSNPTVLSIAQIKTCPNYLWIGTDGEGINRLDISKKEFTHYPNTRGMKISSIANYTDSELILSVYAKGLYLFHIQDGSLTPFPINNQELNQQIKYTGKSINLYNENDKSLLLLSNRIYRYHFQTRQVETISHIHRDIIILPIGSYQGETYLYDQSRLYRLAQNSHQLEEIFRVPSHVLINSVSIDNKGNFWIASNNGLSKYSLSSQQYTPLPTILFKEISSVLCDNRGKVWIGANNTLYAYLISQNNFAIFGESDGVLPNEFLEKPQIISKEGDIYIGGIRGLLCINHDMQIDSLEKPKLILTDVHIDGSSALNEVQRQKGHIEIPWSSKQVHLQIMSLEKDLFRTKIYRFIINGREEQQIESSEPMISLRMLPTGKHTIYVSCTTRNGEWTRPYKILDIDVLPPWYKTWWCILLYILLATISVIGIFIILLRKKSNKLKWAMKEHEQSIYEEKVRFLINISHELRTPLTLIHAPLKRLLHQLQPNDVNYIVLQKIYRQSDRMKRLINMVLDLRKMEVGEKNLQIEECQINKWLSDIHSDFSDECKALDINLILHEDTRINTINIDKGKCEIIVTNLLINALKHSPQHTSITLKSEQMENGMIRISVVDEGPGLHDVDFNKLFTYFYQGNKESFGTGIGLSYAKILVELHSGHIGAYNNPEKGATFYFEIPDNLPVEQKTCEKRAYLNELFIQNETSGQTIEPIGTFNTHQTDLLLVDDSNELLEFLQESLIDRFHHIYTASNGKEALKIIEKHTPHIIVSDIMMPQMNGYELCHYLKSHIDYSHIPVILLTARNEEQSQLEGYKLGADAFLSKPFDIEALYEIICGKLKIREDIRHRYSSATLISSLPTDTFTPTDETFLLKLNKIITEHINDSNLNIPFICTKIGMSRASLYNKLKAITDMGANDYINKIRIEQATHLIETTNLSFSEIADRTGFSTSRYFSTIFKQYTGITPTQYRNKHPHNSNS